MDLPANGAADVWLQYLRALLRIEVAGRILEVELVDASPAGPGRPSRGEAGPRAGCSGPWPFAAPVAVITAWNPGSEPRDRAVNAAAQRRLEAELRTAGHLPWPAEGRSPEGDWSEESAAVPGIELDEAVALGRRHGQRALYWLHDRGAAVVGCLDAPRRVDRPWRSRWLGPQVSGR